MASKLDSDNPNWLFNVIDPKREDFAERAVSPDAKKEDRPQLAQWLIRYLKDYKLRYPQPTSAYSTEELQEMGYVGVYRA